MRVTDRQLGWFFAALGAVGLVFYLAGDWIWGL
jgi:hypothetical protein